MASKRLEDFDTFVLIRPVEEPPVAMASKRLEDFDLVNEFLGLREGG